MNALESTEFTINKANYQFQENNLVEIKYSESSKEDIDPEESLNRLKDLLKSEKHRFLFHNHGFQYSGKKARIISLDFLKERAHGLAIVTKTKMDYGIACVYAALAPKSTTIRVFKNRGEALAWLNEL